MSKPGAITADDLHAFVDGQAADPARVEAWLAENPEDAATVWAYRLQNSRLHEAFDGILSEAVPSELTAIVNRGVRPQPSRTAPVWMRLAASVALLVAGAVGGWYLHGAQSPGAFEPRFADRAIGAHRIFVAEVRHPVEVQADQEAHLVAWLSKRLGTTLKAPSFAAAGFHLVGGRLLADGADPAAQLMYENGGGERVTLYVRPAGGDGETSFRFVEHDGVSAFYWVERNFAYALVAPIARDALMPLANTAYATFDTD